jgi:hypothetical protein
MASGTRPSPRLPRLELRETTDIAEMRAVTDTHIYTPNGIITHGLLTLSANTAQRFLSLW